MIRRVASHVALSVAFVAALAGAGRAATVSRVVPSPVLVRPQGLSVDAKGTKLTKISTDPWTNGSSQHRTEVEPDVFSYGSMMVATFQQGRFYDGGASDVGWATSLDGGTTWQHGSLPGITKIENPANRYDRDTDAAVAYDSKHGVWLIASLPLVNVSGPIGQVPLVSASSDGLHWGNPVLVASNNSDYMDKSWIACDNWAQSPYLGNCYVEYDDVYQGDYEQMSTSTNGGKTWSTPAAPGTYGLAGQPLALPNGTLVVPYLDDSYNISAFSSTNGGKSWGNNAIIATVNTHGVAGGMRSLPLPSAQIDGNGIIYVVWQDCSYRTNCTSNDIVMSTSSDGIHWSARIRIPIDPTTSAVDHFIPGIAADINTGGKTAHLGLTYYYFPQTNCSTSSCQLYAGYVGSTDGGQTWSAPVALTKAMSVNWIAQTDQGQMVGDYIATAFSGGVAHGLFAVAKANRGSTFNEYMATSAKGLPAAHGMMRYTSRGERPVPFAHSDHPKLYPPPIYQAFANE
jgi:hypothetical protein